MQEPGEKVLELNKVKKLQKVSRLSSVTMYSNCFTAEYSLSLMSKVRKNLLVNYLAEIATMECRDQLIAVFCPSESWFADYLVSLKLVVRSFWVQEFESGPRESWSALDKSSRETHIFHRWNLAVLESSTESDLFFLVIVKPWICTCESNFLLRTTLNWQHNKQENRKVSLNVLTFLLHFHTYLFSN